VDQVVPRFEAATAAPAGAVESARPWPDPRTLKVHRNQPIRDVPYLPTDAPVVDAMLRLANVGPGDVVYDLGCGDGRICIAAAKRGARAVGVDIDLFRIRECVENATRANVRDRVKFLRQSFFDTDLREASVVMLYLLSNINVRLRPKLLWELRPGSRLVINHFDIGDWKADATLNAHHRELSLFVIPAWVQGTWKCVVNHPQGRRHMTLRLHRQYQRVWGTAQVDRSEVPISDATLVGARLSFTVFHPQRAKHATQYTCRVDGAKMTGTCHEAGDVTNHWAWGGCLQPSNG
jgi:SAM-dependent methyltransferase